MFFTGSIAAIAQIMFFTGSIFTGRAALPVQRHIGRWNSTPTVTPGSGNVIDGPLIGNGDSGAALTSLRVEQLDFYLGKGDYWADAVNYHWCAHPRVVLSADSPQLLPSFALATHRSAHRPTAGGLSTCTLPAAT